MDVLNFARKKCRVRCGRETCVKHLQHFVMKMLITAGGHDSRALHSIAAKYKMLFVLACAGLKIQNVSQVRGQHK